MIAIRKAEPLLKYDAKLGIAFGFAIVCKTVAEDGTVSEYYDLQGDHIPEDVMVKAASDFAASASRTGKTQHAGEKIADILFAFPLTEEIAKAMDITSKRYGLVIGFKPTSEQALADLNSGAYAGFSFGGEGIRQAVAS